MDSHAPSNASASPGAVGQPMADDVVRVTPRRAGWDDPRPLSDAQLDELRAALSESCADFCRFDVSIGPLTSYKVGGSASVLAEPTNVADLMALAKVVAALDPPIFVLGKGSNLLVGDDGWNGLVIRLNPTDDSEFKRCTFRADPDGDVSTPGAANNEGAPMIAQLGAARFWPQLVRDAAIANFGGLEWSVGIPGTVGGAMRMNAGVSERSEAGELRIVEIGDQLVSTEILNLRSSRIETRFPEQLELAHRHSTIDDGDVVISVTVRGAYRAEAEIDADLSARREIRKRTQEVQNTAGSVWRNADGFPTSGQLIDALGLRGHRVGSAQVSTIHCNFIRTDPGGLAADVVSVMESVWRAVHGAHGLGLVQETEFLGLPRVDVRMAASSGDQDGR